MARRAAATRLTSLLTRWARQRKGRPAPERVVSRQRSNNRTSVRPDAGNIGDAEVHQGVIGLSALANRAPGSVAQLVPLTAIPSAHLRRSHSSHSHPLRSFPRVAMASVTTKKERSLYLRKEVNQIQCRLNEVVIFRQAYLITTRRTAEGSCQ